MVDVDPTSPTFNTVLATIPAGLTTNAFYFGAQLAATPDGRYVYVVYDGSGVGSGYGLAAFDIVNHTVTTTDLATFGATTYQGPIQVTADGRWLLIHSVYANYAGSGIAVCDLSQPTNPTLVGTVNGSLPNSTAPMYFWSFQAVGNRLFAADSYSNAVLAFNFDPVHRDFTQLGVALVPAGRIVSFMAVTPDGALAYIAGLESESISVLDANALANGQPSLITVLANGTVPAQVAVSPIAGPSHMHPTGKPRRNVTDPPIGPSRSSLGRKSL
jgi:DNA-binding beta-propeller fold protein YncE